jgi:hypothetical protein
VRIDREAIQSDQSGQSGRGVEQVPSTPVRKVARKAVAFSMGESLASSPIGDQLAQAGGRSEQESQAEHGAQDEQGEHGGQGERDGRDRGADKQASAVATAEDGFRGAPSELPYRGELEKSFGVSFAGVQAYTDEHARRATERLGAKAYTSGNRIAFAMPQPDKALVAHELTHVLQHTGRGPGPKTGDGGGDGIDVSGEGEAERVEAAVGAQGSARTALHGEAGGGAERDADGEGHEQRDADHGQVDGGGKAAGAAVDGAAQTSAAPARRPALAKSAFGAGMTFSPFGFEKSTTYTLWKKDPPIKVPIGAVPGLSLVVDPSVQVRAAAGVDFRKKGLRTSLGVQGGVGIGLAYGLELAEVYARAGAAVHGGFVFEREKKANSWNLDGGFTLTTDLSVGVKLGGVLDTRFVLGKLEVGTLSKLHWGNDGFKPEGLGWEWGEKIQGFFGTLRSAIDKAKAILNLPKEAAKKAWKELGGTLGGLGNIVKHIHIDLNPFN